MKLQGVGINDADYKVSCSKCVNGKSVEVWRCPYYRRWYDMIRRCYSTSFQKVQPTYTGCSVCEEWLTFSNFKRWMEQQDWEGKQLDKDLLVYQNKVYSPETCVFVSREVNNLTTRRSAKRGTYPLGVTLNKGRFESQACSCGSDVRHLGYFNNPIVAHRAWQQAKVSYAKVLQQEQTDLRVISGLQRVIDKIQNDYDNNLETLDF